jgi:transcriptional regulator with XRE-family HTH domain
MADDLSKYPNHLKKMIKQMGLSVKEVADESGIPLRTLFDYCAGKVPIPRKRLEEIALVIGCSPHCLVPAMQRILSTRQGGFVSDISQQEPQSFVEATKIEARYADAEVASLLNISEGDNIIFYKTYQKLPDGMVIATSETYLPYWFTQILPELYKPDCDIYQLMIRLGKHPFWCTETNSIVQATSVEREVFKLSADDPSALLKIVRRVFDEQGNPLSVDFLTDRGDKYRFHYSFPLFAQDIPEELRDK